MAPLDFGMRLGGDLFPQSTASGEGIAALPESQILRDLGFQSDSMIKDEAEYTNATTAWQTKVTKTFTPQSLNHTIVAIKLETQLKIQSGAGTRIAECKITGSFGNSAVVNSGMGQTTYVDRVTTLSAIANHTPGSSYTLNVQLKLSAVGAFNAYMKNTTLTVFYFDGISLTSNSYLFT